MPKRLVIVESPAKARTISRFLGKDFVVDSSVGHIRDLPDSAAQIPAAVKKERWARLGVNVDEDFAPLYVVPADKKKKVSELKDHLKGADELLLATDEDREGEAISWHLLELLKPKVPFSRLVFHEITREAIHEALENTRPLDERLVSAQETRRIVDRLYGYEVSPLLWKKIAPRLSAGRVQSVAIRLVVERERARIRFREAAYWDVEGLFATAKREEFPATLISLGGKRVALGKDFDAETGKLANPDVVLVDRARAESLAKELCAAPWKVLETETKTYVQSPPAPFTTSTLQQEGARKLRFAARRTMQIAQRLYENGYITYMRTDSTTLSEQAIDAARKAVVSLYGGDYLSAQPRQFKTKVRNAQEAHEAIRPAGDRFRTPAELHAHLHGEDLKLYELIWMRTMACQMAEARGRRMTVRLGAADAVFQASGKVIDFPGFLRVYVEGSDDPEAELAEQETILPAMEKGDPLTCRKLEAKEHRTQPPARFTEASLVKELEANGIGRPSTYASIIDTIERREYTFKRGTALIPTYLAFAVVNLMERHFTELVDLGFTARMEDDLDAISRGEAEALPYLKSFYFGNGQKGLRALLDEKAERIDPREVCTLPLGRSPEGDDIAVRVGRYGPYLQRGDATAPIPDGTAPDEITLERAIEILATAQQGPRVLGKDPGTGADVTVRDGRFGPYVQMGEAEGKNKPKTASLLRGMTPDSVDLATALKLLSLPRVVGQDEAGVDILAANGRFGPFLKRGTDTRSLAGEEQIFTLTREEALALLAQPKQGRRGGAPQALRSLGTAAALDGAEVKLMDGRYGPYVTDGTHNASLPRGADPVALTLEAAVELIEARKARGPVTRRGRKKTTTGAAAARPKASSKAKAPAKAEVGAGAEGAPRPKRATKPKAAKKTAKKKAVRKKS